MVFFVVQRESVRHMTRLTRRKSPARPPDNEPELKASPDSKQTSLPATSLDGMSDSELKELRKIFSADKSTH